MESAYSLLLDYTAVYAEYDAVVYKINSRLFDTTVRLKNTEKLRSFSLTYKDMHATVYFVAFRDKPTCYVEVTINHKTYSIALTREGIKCNYGELCREIMTRVDRVVNNKRLRDMLTLKIEKMKKTIEMLREILAYLEIAHS